MNSLTFLSRRLASVFLLVIFLSTQFAIVLNSPLPPPGTKNNDNLQLTILQDPGVTTQKPSDDDDEG